MKKLLFTLVLAVVSVAGFSQIQGLTVYNPSNSFIRVDAVVSDAGDCTPVGTVSDIVPPRQSIVLPPILFTSNYIWSGISAISIPGGAGVTSSSPCVTHCLTGPNTSTGLTATWDMATNCFRVVIQ